MEPSSPENGSQGPRNTHDSGASRRASSGVEDAAGSSSRKGSSSTLPGSLHSPLKSGMKKSSTYSGASGEAIAKAEADGDGVRRRASLDGVSQPRSFRGSLGAAGASFSGALASLGAKVSRASGLLRSGAKSRGVQQIRSWSKGLIYKAYLAKGARFAQSRAWAILSARHRGRFARHHPRDRMTERLYDLNCSGEGAGHRAQAHAARGHAAAQLQTGASHPPKHAAVISGGAAQAAAARAPVRDARRSEREHLSSNICAQLTGGETCDGEPCCDARDGPGDNLRPV